MTPQLLSRLLAGAAVAIAGCRSYEPRPLALEETQRDFLVRSVDGPSLGDFAARLRAHAPSAGAFDPADGISLPEAEAIALVFNRELRLARLEAGVTRASAENAGLWRDPVLGVDLSQIVSGAADRGVEALASVAFTLPLSGRLELEKQHAAAEHHAQLSRVAAEEWRVIAELRRTWVARASLAAEADAARDFLTRVEQVMAVVDRMEQAGELARIEARLFRIEDTRLRAELQSIESDLVRTTHAIESLLGLPPRDGRAFTGDGAELQAITRESRDAILARLADTSPALGVFRAEHESAERRLALAIRGQWPDLEVAPGFGEQDGDTQAVLGIGVTLPVVNGNRRAIAEADAARELARGRADAALERAITELVAAEDRFALAAARRDGVEQRLIPLVDTQYAEAREVARLGEVNTIILLESLKQQLEAKKQLIAARRDETLAAIDIAETAGPARVGPARKESTP